MFACHFISLSAREIKRKLMHHPFCLNGWLSYAKKKKKNLGKNVLNIR